MRPILDVYFFAHFERMLKKSQQYYLRHKSLAKRPKLKVWLDDGNHL